MKKQTASNNEYLAGLKATWNHKIFKKASAIYNQSGREATVAYLQQFTTAKLS